MNAATVTAIECDLADFDSVRRAAEAVKAACPSGLDVLVRRLPSCLLRTPDPTIYFGLCGVTYLRTYLKVRCVR